MMILIVLPSDAGRSDQRTTCFRQPTLPLPRTASEHNTSNKTVALKPADMVAAVSPDFDALYNFCHLNTYKGTL
ncbi:hypothetical protein BH20ACI2_BH20ACI2_01070 [soil metagenome]